MSDANVLRNHLLLVAVFFVIAGGVSFPVSATGGDIIVARENRPGLMDQLKARNEPEVLERDGWRLETEVLHPGSRSQGYHGVLSHDGERVGGTPGELRETPLGTLRYEGSRAERAHAWSHSGWRIIEPAPAPDVTAPVTRSKMPPGAKFH